MEGEALAAFDSAVARLSENDRKIVLMRRKDGFSNLEVAKALAMTPQAASMRYLRAVRRLKELMVEPERPGPQ